MNLLKKKMLAARTLNVGRERIVFNTLRLADIKEAITKQDIRDLYADGAIAVKEINGRKTVKKGRKRRRTGSVRKPKKKGKRNYMILTRKLRAYVLNLRKNGKMAEEEYQNIRKQIRASFFKDIVHMKEHIAQSIKK